MPAAGGDFVLCCVVKPAFEVLHQPNGPHHLARRSTGSGCLAKVWAHRQVNVHLVIPLYLGQGCMVATLGALVALVNALCDRKDPRTEQCDVRSVAVFRVRLDFPACLAPKAVPMQDCAIHKFQGAASRLAGLPADRAVLRRLSWSDCILHLLLLATWLAQIPCLLELELSCLINDKLVELAVANCANKAFLVECIVLVAEDDLTFNGFLAVAAGVLHLHATASRGLVSAGLAESLFANFVEGSRQWLGTFAADEARLVVVLVANLEGCTGDCVLANVTEGLRDAVRAELFPALSSLKSSCERIFAGVADEALLVVEILPHFQGLLHDVLATAVTHPVVLKMVHIRLWL
mmetsp:Transcript_8081/g.17581  ORF Transcript_8081/g.17581 Transcript_8081/m.17581 type:complete len:349 (+) Transcript_8081:575-1621(+)